MCFGIKIDKQYFRLFSIINLLGLAACFVDVKIGIVSSAIILIMCLLHYNVEGYFSDFVFCVYVLVSIVSVVSYAWNGRPIIIFVKAISFNLIPSLLYLQGKYVAQINMEVRWGKCVLNAFCFMMLFGTLTYLLVPDFYYQHIGQSVEDFAYGLGDYRYGSFISSLAMGSVGTISIALYFFLFDRLAVWQKITYLPLIILNVALCMQRSAWLVSFAVLFLSLLYRFWDDIKSRWYIMGVASMLLILLVVVWLIRELIFTPAQLLYFEQRIGTINIDNMFSSRSDQWINAIKVFKQYPFIGFGLGSCGQKAAPYGLAVVTDGNHLRILAEIGVFGFVAFCFMNIRAIWRAIIYKRFYFALVIVACNFAAIGSPIFDQYYASFVYWLILGCASAQNVFVSVNEDGDEDSVATVERL